MSKYITIRETAAWMGVAEVTVRKWVAARKIGSAKFGRAVRVSVEDLQRFISENTFGNLRGAE
jgi:excisionase family DNA binding protein